MKSKEAYSYTCILLQIYLDTFQESTIALSSSHLMVYADLTMQAESVTCKHKPFKALQ